MKNDEVRKKNNKSNESSIALLIRIGKDEYRLNYFDRTLLIRLHAGVKG